MRSLTLDEFRQIVDFVHDYHPFSNIGRRVTEEQALDEYPNLYKFIVKIKYIIPIYDSRFNEIYELCFDNIRFNVNDTKGLDEDLKLPFESMFDWIMAYLKGEYKWKLLG